LVFDEGFITSLSHVFHFLFLSSANNFDKMPRVDIIPAGRLEGVDKCAW